MMDRSRSSSPLTTTGFRLTDRQHEANRLLAAGQRHTLLVGGARSGKTFLLVRAVMIRAVKAAGSRHAILRFRANAVKASIARDTIPKVAKTCFPGLGIEEKKQEGYFVLPNGSELWTGGLDDSDRVEKILGQEFATILFNECSQIPYSSILVARTRLAQVVDGIGQRAYYDLNPSGTGHWTYAEFIEGRDPVSKAPLPNAGDFKHLFLNPSDNRANLSPEFLASLETLPEKQRRRFFEGRYVAEIDGALWTLDLIERQRLDPSEYQPGSRDLRRIIVAVDPSGASAPEDTRSDEIGIVVVGKASTGEAIVLEDGTTRDGPAGWARRVAGLVSKWGADAIVAERNFGGAMVEANIRTSGVRVPVKLLTASRGKHVRAEPVSALYEQGMVRHLGRFPEMEDQMLNFSTAGYLGDRSPDRADALVWALSELMLEQQAFAGIGRVRT